MAFDLSGDFTRLPRRSARARKERIGRLLKRGKTLDEAAAAEGIAPHQLKKWLTDDAAFRARVEHALNPATPPKPAQPAKRKIDWQQVGGLIRDFTGKGPRESAPEPLPPLPELPPLPPARAAVPPPPANDELRGREIPLARNAFGIPAWFFTVTEPGARDHRNMFEHDPMTWDMGWDPLNPPKGNNDKL